MTRPTLGGMNLPSTPIDDVSSSNTTDIPQTPVRRDCRTECNRIAEARDAGTVQPVRLLVCKKGGNPRGSCRERFPLHLETRYC